MEYLMGNLGEEFVPISCKKRARGILARARDDQDVPFAVSERLAGLLAPPTRLIALPAGGHKGPQRSPLVARATLHWALQQA